MFIVVCYILIMGLIALLINSSKNKKCFVVISGMSLFLIAAFRSIHFGPDVIGYVNKYYYLSFDNLSVYWSNFINNTGKDPFFYLFSKIINEFGLNQQVWLGIISLIFIFSVSRFIYKYSEEPYISFIALISLGYFFFSLTGLRQALSLAIILLSYKYLRDRRLMPFIFIIILASLFHSSALIFLIAYPVIKMKIGIKHTLVIMGALVISIFFDNQIRTLIEIVAWNDSLSEYAKREASLSFSGFVIQLLIYLFCLFYKNRVIKNDSKNLSYYNLLLIGLIFQVFSSTIAEFFRISMYFSIFGIVLIPKVINEIKDKNIKIIVYLCVLSALITYVLWSKVFIGYTFFWREV